MTTPSTDIAETALPRFLVPEKIVREDGSSTEIDLGGYRGKVVTVTLGITRIIEQESLDLSIWGSPDKTNWSSKPLLGFPQKFYCGTYSMVLDLTDQPDIGYLKVQWKLGRWGRGEPKPLFGFYVFAQEAPAVMRMAS